VTVRGVLSAMLRRWYVPLAVLIIAGAFTMVLARDGGIYSTRTVISFTYPTKTTLSYGNGTNDSSVIAFAGAVVSEINNGRPVERYSDDSAPLYGAGVRDAVRVGLTAAGNQWATSFPRADIEIQIVGRTEAEVASRQKKLVDRVLEVAESKQSSATAAADEHIAVAVVPLTLDIQYIAAGRSGIVFAVGAMSLAALIVGAWGAAVVDGWVGARGGPRRGVPAVRPRMRESLS